MPKVSVNIACYNHEEYIGKAIQSVLDQTFQDFEIIICNNGSTDNSLNIIKSFNDPRIKVESIFPNQQSTYAGNNCIERGCGEYVALLCSDDFWEKDKLEKQVQFLDSHPNTGVVFTRVQPVLPNNKYIHDKKNFYYKHFNILENRNSMEWLYSMLTTVDHSFCCSSACVRRECLEYADNFDIRSKHIQDFILWADICTKYDVYIIDEMLTCMRYFPDKDNLSALNDNTIIATLNEMQLLFDKFKKIKDLNKFLEFLPQTRERFNYIHEKYIPFYLSILTIERTWHVNLKSSAISYLYNFLSDKNTRIGLEKDLNFTHMDLYNIATTTDVYRHKKVKTAKIWYTLLTIYTLIKLKIEECICQ